jgi:hypothetical protein
MALKIETSIVAPGEHNLDIYLQRSARRHILKVAELLNISTMVQLAKNLGLTRARLYHWCDELGITSQVRKVCARRYNMRTRKTQ